MSEQKESELTAEQSVNQTAKEIAEKGEKVVTTTPEASVGAVSHWRNYEVGKGDRAGRKITKIYALDDRYVIYFVECELFYEPKTGLATDLGKADAALHRINRLLDLNQKKGSKEYIFDLSTLELAAGALEMFFCEEKTEALEILDGVRDKLLEKEEVQRRLAYQVGAVSITALFWILYLSLHWIGYQVWKPWMLAAALAMAGGLFSVCLNIASLEVNVNQAHLFVGFAGATRSVVAFLAGIGLLLAMRSKMFAGIIYPGGVVPGGGGVLEITEMFFCFLAGFSEAFVPNILSKAAADKAPADKKTPTPTPAPTPAPLSITTQPANTTVNVGETAMFSVTATGSPPLQYQWRKNCANIPGATNSSYTTPATVAADNGSLFSVVVSNSAGSVTSNNATLTVN